MLEVAWIKHPFHKEFVLYFRLDYIFISAPLITNTVGSEINPVTWSDQVYLYWLVDL